MHSILLFAFLALGYASYVPDVPLFVWSGEDTVVSRNEQIRGYYNTEDVSDLLKGLFKSSHHDQHGLLKLVKHNTEHPVELVVLLVDSALSSEEVAKHNNLLPTVAQKMQESHSFYVPFVSASDSHLLHSVCKAAKHAHKVGGATYFLGSDEALAKLQEHAETKINRITSFSDLTSSFTNGKTDVLIIFTDDECAEKRLTFLDEQVKLLDETFTTAQFSNYVVALTGAKSSLKDTLPSATEMGVPESLKRTIFVAETPVKEGNSSCPSGSCPPPVLNGRNGWNVYFNGVFWELFFILITVFGLILFGIKQLLLLQAPDKIPQLANAQKKKKQ